MYDVEDILPEVVILFYVFGEAALNCTIKDEILQIANITSVMCVKVVFAFLVTQFCERVYNNSEDNIQTNDIDNNLKTSIMHQFKQVLFCFIIKVYRLSNVTNSTAISQTLVKLCYQTLQHG